jgi:hypothetical protein
MTAAALFQRLLRIASIAMLAVLAATVGEAAGL